MTFSLIDELRKELAKTEQLIEFDISKRDQLLEAIRILEANEKPKRRIYTICNNEAPVKMIIPADEYEAYRNLFPDDDAIEVCVKDDEMSYAAGSAILVKAYRPSLTKEDDPQLFADVLDMLEREEAMNAFRGKVKPIAEESQRYARCTTVSSLSSYELKPPNWNYNGAEGAAAIADKYGGEIQMATQNYLNSRNNGGVSAIEVAVTKDTDVKGERE